MVQPEHSGKARSLLALLRGFKRFMNEVSANGYFASCLVTQRFKDMAKKYNKKID